MQTRPIVLLGAFAVSTFLTACTTPMSTLPPGPQAFRVGYSEGCDAGYSVAGSPFYEKRDHVDPGSADPEYLAGWKNGFHRCKANYDRIQTTVFAILGPSL